MSDVPLLSADNVARSYRLRTRFGRRASILHAVRDVSLNLLRGETLGIVGESGCGKSTLARLLLGLESPDLGTVRLAGKPVSEVPRMEFSSRVQPVFQDPFSTLNPRRSILDTVKHPLVIHKRGSSPDREKLAGELLDMVGLPKRAHHSYPTQLSGGQRQRVAIARALVLRPDVLICDEPTSALDVSIQAQILNLIRDMQKEFGVGIIFISHNLAVVEHVADNVTVMYLGRAVESGPTRRVMTSPQHPYTHALLSSVLTPDPSLGLPDLHMGTSFPDPTNPPPGCGFHPRCRYRAELCRTEMPTARQVQGATAECHFAGQLVRAISDTP
ncbi:ATP-binding cassette domain-containing protein [Sinorhizobium meliloti]|nr:ATP-binding cassette domain-containing protein [Sinorhizobium meliloti]